MRAKRHRILTNQVRRSASGYSTGQALGVGRAHRKGRGFARGTIPGGPGVMRERRRLEEAIAATRKIETELADTVELIEMAAAEGDIALVDDGVRALSELADKAERDKVAALLAGEADANNSYVEINAGAGGTESNDWAACPACTRWGERHGMKVALVPSCRRATGIKSRVLQGANAMAIQGRGVGPPTGPDQPVRQFGAPPHQLCVGVGISRSRRRHRY